MRTASPKPSSADAASPSALLPQAACSDRHPRHATQTNSTARSVPVITVREVGTAREFQIPPPAKRLPQVPRPGSSARGAKAPTAKAEDRPPPGCRIPGTHHGALRSNQTTTSNSNRRGRPTPPASASTGRLTRRLSSPPPGVIAQPASSRTTDGHIPASPAPSLIRRPTSHGEDPSDRATPSGR